MSFLIYFFVLLVSAASVLFGLDLMSSPLPKTPNVPIGRSVQVTTPPEQQQRAARVADERALTPVYPTEPGKPKIQAETSGAAPQEQQKAALTPAPAQPAPATSVAQVAQPPAAQAPQPQPVAQAPQPSPEVKTEPVAAAQPAATEKTEPVAAAQPAPEKTEPVASAQAAPDKTEPVASAQPASELKQQTVAATQPAPAPAAEAKPESTATVQPAMQQAPKSCNVQACGAAYQSFRAADCTYQPMSGARRVCTISGATTAASRASKQTVREATGKDEIREVERIVKRQPLQLSPAAAQPAQAGGRGEMREVERIVRRMTRNENADVAVQDGDGNILIVRKGYR